MSGLRARTSRLRLAGLETRRMDALGMRYAVLAPRRWESGRVVVAVHGISRNWHELAECFVPLCARANATLVVPRFSRRGYRGYQRLSSGSRGVAADLALEQVLDDAARHLGLPDLGRLCLFGFSGGAQFAHRFTLAHPARVKRQVLAAAGFYTMPDSSVAFPYGLGAEPVGRGPMSVDGLAVPTRVLVGDLDDARDADLRQNKRLDRQQGLNRIERARRFVLAVRAAVGSRGRAPECTFELLDGCDHSFSGCVREGGLARRSVDFLLDGEARDADVATEAATLNGVARATHLGAEEPAS